jgi:DNA-binding response OmpR family regulator
VLVVEDEPLVGLDLVDMLEAAGAHVLCAKRAGEAISSLDRFQITAAALDINLGDHDCSVSASIFGSATSPSPFTPDTAPL